MTTIYDFSVEDANGKSISLSQYKGKNLLIVNVASKCGFTPQYEGLEKLYEASKDKGFTILGFPCNQFMGQEKGSNEEIQQFCKMNYGVTFPVFAKIEVNGKQAHPLYQYLTSNKDSSFGGNIKWNFTKFLIDKDGVILNRFEPKFTPEQIMPVVEALLQKA
jgi:glutathione peroxidase